MTIVDHHFWKRMASWLLFAGFSWSWIVCSGRIMDTFDNLSYCSKYSRWSAFTGVVMLMVLLDAQLKSSFFFSLVMLWFLLHSCLMCISLCFVDVV